MQDRSTYPGPSSDAPTAYGNGATATPVASTEPYVHPTIPLGLPHVVNFVEASMHHLPMSVRFVGDRMSRYANAQGVVSMAVPFICQITGLGSKNTAEHHIRLMESLGVLEKRPGKGGKDRKSNTYVFLGEQRKWRPLPTERPGTDPWIALAQARRENEELRAEIARLKNGGAVSHSGVTDGYETEASDPTPHSYGTARIGASTEDGGAIGHYGVTDGQEAEAPEPTSRSYENPDSNASTEDDGAISHSGVTDGPAETLPQEESRSHEAPDSEPSPTPREATGHSEVTGEPDEGQQYLARRARVEELVMTHGAYYRRSFSRHGLPAAVEYFSRSDENEQELLRQVRMLGAGEDPRQPGTGPPVQAEEQPDPDRYAFGYCPDCGKPFATYGGAEYCTDCTQRRRRESEA